MGTRIVTLRMQDDQADMLAQMAAEQGESLSAFVRGRIFARESLEAEFQALQSSLLAALSQHRPTLTESAAPAPSGGARDPRAMGAIVETLLLMRSLSNPTKMQAVRAEVSRLGFQPFG